MAERRLLGEGLTFDERIHLAQLTAQPGWPILVRLMAEACRISTEAVIKLDPATTERYNEVVGALQMTARAMHKFSGEVLDSVKVHSQTAFKEAQVVENPKQAEKKTGRFDGFKFPPTPESPTEGE